MIPFCVAAIALNDLGIEQKEESAVVLMCQVNKLEPVAAFTAPGFSLVQVHPVYAHCILLTYAANQSFFIQGGYLGGFIHSALCPLLDVHLERVLVACQFGKQLISFNAHRMSKRVWHGHFI